VYVARDITGQKFGSLTAVRRLSPIGSPGRARWLFLCDCGKEVDSERSVIVSGKVRQCVTCGHKKQAIAITKHGVSGTREFNRFYQAKARCTNPNNDRYHDYGGRGIQWRFESHEQAFAELGPCPPGLTLDRIDNDGHYEPGNVRWANWKTQFASRRPWNWRKLKAA